MGIFDQGILGQLFGSDNSGRDAARAANEGNQRGIDEIGRQFDLSREDLQGLLKMFQPFIDSGAGQLGELERGASAGGLDERLGEIFGSENFQNLRDERTRSLQNQLGASGLQRSGTALQEISNIPTQLGFDIENQLFGRQSGIANRGLGALGGAAGVTGQQANLGAQASGNIANLLSQQGQNTSSGILADQQASAQRQGQIAQIASMAFFSDPRLKENVEKVSSIGDLGLFQWDWIPETEGTVIAKGGTIGFMADEVHEKYPQHAGAYCGWMVINYPALLNELADKYGLREAA